jgi:hypothetical protein
MWSCWWVAVEGRLSSVASQDPPLVHEARCFRAAVHRMNCPVSIQFTVNRRLPEEGEAASQPHGFKTLFLASDMPTVVSPVSASGTCRWLFRMQKVTGRQHSTRSELIVYRHRIRIDAPLDTVSIHRAILLIVLTCRSHPQSSWIPARSHTP